MEDEFSFAYAAFKGKCLTSRELNELNLRETYD